MCGFCHHTPVTSPLTSPVRLASNSLAKEWCACAAGASTSVVPAIAASVIPWMNFMSAAPAIRTASLGRAAEELYEPHERQRVLAAIVEQPATQGVAALCGGARGGRFY